jgi:hypothetical protein
MTILNCALCGADVGDDAAHECPASPRASIAAARTRLSVREATRFVLGKLNCHDAQKLHMQLRSREPSLTRDESAARLAVFEAAGIHGAMHDLGAAMTLGRREKRTGGGRQGAPARDSLRRELRALRRVLVASVDADDRRHVARMMAILVMLYDFDQHGVWWSTRQAHPPMGAERVRWLVKRIVDLVGDGSGQYAARNAKTHRTPRPRASTTYTDTAGRRAKSR